MFFFKRILSFGLNLAIFAWPTNQRVFFSHGYTADGGCRVRRRVRKLKNKGRDLTLQISDYVILMSLDTFLTLFSSYHSYFCLCRPSKKVVQMWKSWVCFNFFKFSKNSPWKNQEKIFFDFKNFFSLLVYCWNIDLGTFEDCFRTLENVFWPNVALFPSSGPKT